MTGQVLKSAIQKEIVNSGGVHRFGRLPNHTLTGLIVSTLPPGLELYSADSCTVSMWSGLNPGRWGGGQNPTLGTPTDPTPWEPAITQADLP